MFKNRKVISIFVVTVFLLSMIAGCGLPGDQENGNDLDKSSKEKTDYGIDTDFDPIKKTLKRDDGIVKSQGISIEVDDVFLEEDSYVKILKMQAPAPLENTKVNAYKFEVDTSSYNGLYTITIPYEPGEGEIGAGYYNEGIQKWEPVVYEIDKENNEVIITTDHLSTYASFKVVEEGTRSARLESNLFEAHNHLGRYESDYGAIIQESFGPEMSPGSKAYDLGKSVVDDWFMASGMILEFEGVAYSSNFLDGLSTAFGNVGLALSMAQLAVDYSHGNDQEMAVNAFNTSQGVAIGKWGTKALKLSMVGVTAIDYSITKLAEDAIGGREDVWREAYRLYYRENHQRSYEDWYHRLLELHDHAESPEQFDRLMNTELNRYTYKFWHEDESIIGDYQVEAQGHGFTGGGGLNEDLKEEIADEYKAQLLSETFCPVFRRIEKEIRYEQFKDYQAELASARDKLNKVVDFEIVELLDSDEEAKYAGYTVQFGPLSEDADTDDWTGTLNDEGRAKSRFTVLGHMSSGAPDEIRLYETEKDLEKGNPALTQEFVVDVPHTIIEICGIEGELEGSWKGTMVVEETFLCREGITKEDINQLMKEGPDTGEKVEGFEEVSEECEEGMEQLMYEYFKTILELVGEEIRTKMTFNSTSQENTYTGVLSVEIDQDFGAEEDTAQDVKAEHKDGVVTLKSEDGMIYTGKFKSEDKIAGTFEMILEDNEMDGSFLEGSWEVNRIE